jgi:hypothetical protein
MSTLAIVLANASPLLANVYRCPNVVVPSEARPTQSRNLGIRFLLYAVLGSLRDDGATFDIYVL